MKVNVTFLGGSFGRKIVPDYVVQAVHASKAVGRPVKLIRTREEDLQHGIFRVNAGGRFRAVLDDTGYPLAVHARVVGQSLFGATRKSWLDETPEGAWDESMVDGIYNQSYRLANFLVETIDTPLSVPVYFMRSVGSTAAVFFWESFISELAHAAKIDQYTYRRSLLAGDPLALRVLDAVAEAAKWREPPPAGMVRGIAYNCYVGRGGRFRTYVAQVVELAPMGDRYAVKRVYCAVDPGLAVNPNTLTAQIEGGIGFALTTALHSRITFANGGVEQTNFLDYPLLSIDEMPEIVPIVLPSDRPPQGFGEVVLAPVAPPSPRPCCRPPAGGSTSCRCRPMHSGDSDGRLHAPHQRHDPQSRGRRRHAAALGAARQSRIQRHQVRLRRGAVRRLHRARRRQSAAVLFAAGVGAGRTRGHDHRGRFGPGSGVSAAGLDRARRPAMRLLPVRADPRVRSRS